MFRQSLSLERNFFEMRKLTTMLCEGLALEDYVVQPVSEVSPPKWHLGHTTWFLEELILNRFLKNYQFYNPLFRKIYNSYYKGLGEHWVQGERGQLSRPTVAEVYLYREIIDEKMHELFDDIEKLDPEILNVIELAINHEEQHQELLLMDIKVILGVNPSLPAYIPMSMNKIKPREKKWISIPEGLYEAGVENAGLFHFDNESPRHKVYLRSFAIADQLVTNDEYLNFVNEGGYKNPLLWKSLGLDWVRTKQIKAPLYWLKEGLEFTLFGEQEIDLNAPVSHISYFEADAFARWAGMRLPNEFEFEIASLTQDSSRSLKDTAIKHHPENTQTFGEQLWCWSDSQYSPYPGFEPFSGKAQEYNGKFMCNQFVLRGGCVATPSGHYRKSYRNFYEPAQRWMFSGFALAKDVK